LKYEKLNLIRKQIKDNLIILTHKTNTLITLITFPKKCEKSKGSLHIRTEEIPTFLIMCDICQTSLEGAYSKFNCEVTNWLKKTVK